MFYIVLVFLICPGEYGSAVAHVGTEIEVSFRSIRMQRCNDGDFIRTTDGSGRQTLISISVVGILSPGIVERIADFIAFITNDDAKALYQKYGFDTDVE